MRLATSTVDSAAWRRIVRQYDPERRRLLGRADRHRRVRALMRGRPRSSLLPSTAARPYFYASSALGMTFRFCRGPSDVLYPERVHWCRAMDRFGC